MSQSPSINRQYNFLHSSTSTPVLLQTGSPASHRLKSATFKQINHNKIRNQSSPYYSANHFTNTTERGSYINNALFNYQHCDDSESDITNTSNDTSLSSIPKTNPPTTPISSLIATSTESSPSIITKTELLHVTPATTSNESSRAISSNVTSYSRSSSYTSLSSFETKSTHSSVQSDYSSQANSACYSDIPNSPVEANQFYNKINFSVMTVDSNPSRSNDITIMEKTVLGNCSKNGMEPLDEDEQVVNYDMEGSISDCRSVKSNVSQLTFPNEPTADLNFLRNLLGSKKSTNEQKPAWSNVYTPPVKLDSTPKISTESQVSKTLFPDFRNDFFANTSTDDMDKDSIKYYNDEEDKESCTSKASVPSIIRSDMENNLINRVHLNVLYEKLNSTKDSSLLEKTQVNDMSQIEEEEEDDQKILFEFIDECFNNNRNVNNEEEDEEPEARLPKIEEEENENESFVEKIKVKKTAPVVQMTKTAMLRANKLKEMAAQSQNKFGNQTKKNTKFDDKKNLKNSNQTISLGKPTFKFNSSSQTHGVKKPNQVLTSINNWQSK